MRIIRGEYNRTFTVVIPPWKDGTIRWKGQSLEVTVQYTGDSSVFKALALDHKVIPLFTGAPALLHAARRALAATRRCNDIPEAVDLELRKAIHDATRH